jgi:hypothetical protein
MLLRRLNDLSCHDVQRFMKPVNTVMYLFVEQIRGLDNNTGFSFHRIYKSRVRTCSQNVTAHC